MICLANGTSRSAVTWDAAARRAQVRAGDGDAARRARVGGHPTAGLQAAGIAGARWYPAAGHAGRGMAACQTGNGRGSGVDWVTMSDSCHTERTRIGETLGSQPGAAARAARTPAPAGFSGIVSRCLGDHHRPGQE